MGSVYNAFVKKHTKIILFFLHSPLVDIYLETTTISVGGIFTELYL